jgi:hypothetical protein
MSQVGQSRMTQDFITLFQNGGMQFRVYGLFISGIFHIVLLDHLYLWVTETMASEALNNYIPVLQIR